MKNDTTSFDSVTRNFRKAARCVSAFFFNPPVSFESTNEISGRYRL